MRGVRRIDARDARSRAPDPPAGPRRPDRSESPAAFEIETRGEWTWGRAEGIDARQLRRLRRGEIATDRRVDLHGLDAAAARVAVRRAIQSALDADERCVLLVHGRGHRSVAGPVLKRALPGWLAEPPLGAKVMAFASAPPSEGGPGATRVLLRRVRR
jgi:DNA-nicking Smr family endonuclease